MSLIKSFAKKCISLVEPEWDYWRRAKRYYLVRTGKKLHYSHPADLNEKLMWLTRYWRHPLKTKCADKYQVRSYLSSLGLDHLSVPLLGVYSRAEDINFEALPDQFVLKCNHGSGYNVIVLDKASVDICAIKTRLNEWMSKDFSEVCCEIHYKDIARKIVCEKLLSDTAPLEYQFWCLNGDPESVLVCRKNFDGSYDSWSYSIAWERLYDRIEENSQSLGVDKPENLEKMLEYAKRLSEPFPFVRVDFYESGGEIYLAELTFTPCANILDRYKSSFIKRLGDKLILPRPYSNRY